MKINDNCFVEANEVPLDNIRKLITIRQEEIVRRKEQLRKTKEEWNDIEDGHNKLDVFMREYHNKVREDKQIDFNIDRNREFYNDAIIYMNQNLELILQNKELSWKVSKMKE